jgi:multidrug efflux pump subunit AcrB
MAFTRGFPALYDTVPEIVEYHVIDGMGAVNRAWAGVSLKPWNERERTQAQIQTELQHKLDQVAGLQTAVFPPPSLPGSHGLPFQFVVNATTDYEPLYRVSERLLEQARASGLFASISSDLTFDRPQLQVRVKRDLAGQLGITLEDIGTALGTMLGGDYVNRFSWHGRSYKVIPQVPRQFRSNPDLLQHYHIRTGSGSLVPLATLVTLNHTVQPSALNQFQQLNAATLQGVLAAGVTQSEALAFLQRQADQAFPAGFGSDYGGGLRRYTQEGNTLVYAFLFALLVIYLVLAAQFESFRDPLVILISVPMSLCGALIPLNLGFATINIYTQIGLITLVGLISKHGILMVEFANQLQRTEGLSPRLAMEKAAAIRLRPVLMTTVAMVAGVIPLLLASGAGAISRFSIGLVIGSGMTVGTLFTLFVVPVMYTLMAERRQRNGTHWESGTEAGGGHPLSPESGHSRRRG